MAILNRDTYDTPLDFDGDTRIGVCYFTEPAYLHGYYYTPDMQDVKFVDSPKRLPNDVIWITNQPFDPQNSPAVYIKNKYFLRVPFEKLLEEVAPDLKDKTEKIKRLTLLLRGLELSEESGHLRHALSMTQAVYQHMKVPKAHDNWLPLGIESLSYYWKGSVKHTTLYGGSLLAPRYDTIRQLIQIPIPDFTRPPIVIKKQMNGEILRQFLLSTYGFVRLTIESVDRSIQDFIDLERTLWTTYEALWLLDRANITCRAAYVTEESISHPLKNTMYFDRCAPFSWLDGLRSEIMYLGVGYGSHPYQSWFRANAHIAMAYCSEFLENQGIACIGLSMNKIKIGYKDMERLKIAQLSQQYGFLLQQEELPGIDFSKELV